MAVNAGFVNDRRFVLFALSTDKMPTTWQGQPVPMGSELYLTDLNQKWLYSGPTLGWFNTDQVTDTEEIANEDPILNALENISEQLSGIQETLSELAG